MKFSNKKGIKTGFPDFSPRFPSLTQDDAMSNMHFAPFTYILYTKKLAKKWTEYNIKQFPT